MKLEIWETVEDDYPFRKDTSDIAEILITGNWIDNLKCYINELIIYKR